MKIATFNVNGIKGRLPRLLEWLAREKPDAVALQEIKTTDSGFPKLELAKAGYASEWVGEKSYNGVAILARGTAPVLIRRALPGDASDVQARYIEAAVRGVIVGCLYHARFLKRSGVPVILAGDFNVVPTERDIYTTTSYDDNALVQPESRGAYRRLLRQGWIDSLRALHPDETIYTFWDYLRKRWERNAGLRIDHLLLDPTLATRLKSAGVDRWVRAENGASDHAPTWVVLDVVAPARRRKRAKLTSTKLRGGA